MKKKISCSRLFLWIFLILVIGYTAFWIIPNFIVTVQIASRLHVAPSWSAIRHQLANNEFKSGMTRDKVHSLLDQVGVWIIFAADSPDQGIWDSDTQQTVFRETIRFTGNYTYQALGSWIFLYDKNGKLISQGPVDSG